MGLIVIGRGFYKYTLLQTLLGILVVAWGLVAWFWINLSFYDARTVYIKGSVVSSVLRNSLVVSPGVPLGLALIQVGKRKKRL